MSTTVVQSEETGEAVSVASGSGAGRASESIQLMREMSVRLLSRMYLPNKRLFVHCIRRGPLGILPEGVSRRYTAITLIGLATESEEAGRASCGGHSPQDVCARLLEDIDSVTNMGDVALTLWAARLLRHPQAHRALDRLRAVDPVRGAHETVEIAWALTALSCCDNEQDLPAGDAGLAKRVFGRLASLFCESSSAFRHVPPDANPSIARAHICCFADLVYPTQAMSYYGQMTGEPRAIEMARACAAFMSRGQGPDGQWWWHFDTRTGATVEGYPVYSVHQDSMAPMALFAAMDACKVDHTSAILKGLDWLNAAPELVGGSLIDVDADIIWRKVARAEPGKLSRGAQALASRVHPSLRVPGLGMIFRAGKIDYESRPYHMGWILHAFSPSRLARWAVTSR